MIDETFVYTRSYTCLASSYLAKPAVVDLQSGEISYLPTPSVEGGNSKTSKIRHNEVAVYNRKGTKVVCGNAKGIIRLLDAETLEVTREGARRLKG